jgi:hypothetical protein
MSNTDKNQTRPQTNTFSEDTISLPKGAYRCT